MSTIRTLSFILLLILNHSCGETNEEKIEHALEKVNQFLTARECDKALELLHSIGYQGKNIEYLQSYASAYACRAGFDEPTFFGNDLSKISATQTGFIGSLTTFSSSSMSSNTDQSFTDLFAAVNTLLYAGVTTSSSAGRRAAFSNAEINDLDIQTLYMLLALMGKYFYFYGNAGTTGIKGGGTLGNECLIDYTDGNAKAGIGLGDTGSCDQDNEGNAYLTATKNARCEGIILFNNFVDIITNLTIPGSNTGDLGNLGTIFNSLCSDAGGVLPALCLTRDINSCSSLDNDEIERFFVFIFEKNFL